MKHFFYFTAAAVAFLVINGCEQIPSPKPVFEPVSSEDMTVPCSGGIFSVAYEIVNPSENGDVLAHTEADWITDFDYSVFGEVKFLVEENIGKDKRESVIFLEYEYSEGESLEFGVKIVQEAAGDLPPEPDDDPFTIEVYEIGATSAKVKTTPLDMELTYTSQLMTKADFEYQVGDVDNAQQWLRETFEYMAYSYGMTFYDFMRAFLISGVEDYPYTGLLPETEHIVFAVGLDYECNFTTEFYIGANFFTMEFTLTDLSFTMDVVPEARTAFVVTTPSDMTANYVVFPIMQSDCAGLSDEDIIQSIIDAYSMFIEVYVVYGINERNFTGLEPDTDYYALAFGFEPSAFMYTSNLHKEPFTTLNTGDPTKVTFDISADRISAYFADITVKPSDASVFYLYNVIQKSLYESYGGDKDALQRYSDELIDELYQDYVGYGYTWEEIVEQFYVAGETTFTAECLVPETEYYVWAATCDEQGVFLSEPALVPFVTEQHVPSDAYVPGIVDEYFDGYEIAEYNPLYGGYQGMVVVPIVYEPNDLAVDWCVSVFQGDVVAMYGEDDVFLSTLESSQWGQNIVGIPTFALMYDQPYTVTTIAVDEDGNYGEMYHQVYTMTKDGVAPPENVDYYFNQFMPYSGYPEELKRVMPKIMCHKEDKPDCVADTAESLDMGELPPIGKDSSGKIIKADLF